jgi:DNA-binding transcriptional LysR family regulator
LIDLPLRALRYFAAAAEHGNVSLAARTLNVSQPSISLAIAQIEAALGVALFVRRHARGVALTPAGTEVLREARKLLAQASDFAANVAAVGEGLRGTLSIGCLTYLVPRYLPALLAGFVGRHPAIDLAFREGDPDELQGWMLEGQIEAALTYEVALPRRFATETLLDLPAYAIVPQRHRLANRGTISLSDLVAEPCVLLDLPISRDYFAAIFGVIGVPPNVRFRTKSVEAVRGFVANGLGYSVLNHPSHTSTTYDGRRIRSLTLTDPLPPARIAAMRLAGHTPRPTARAFLEHAREYFAAEAAQ